MTDPCRAMCAELVAQEPEGPTVMEIIELHSWLENEITPPPELVRKWQIKIQYCINRADREAVVAQLFQLGIEAVRARHLQHHPPRPGVPR